MTNARLEILKNEDVFTIAFTDSRILDDTNINKIGEELFAIVAEHSPVKMILDFEKVDYLSSAVLGKLVALHKKVAKGAGKLVLCGIKPSILEIFRITKLVKVFVIRDSLDEAAASLGS